MDLYNVFIYLYYECHFAEQSSLDQGRPFLTVGYNLVFAITSVGLSRLEQSSGEG